MSKPIQKLSLKKIKDSSNLYHEESGLVMKSAVDKRVVVGRMENGKIVGIDKKTRELCKEYASTYQFVLENVEESEEASEEEDETSEGASEQTTSEEESGVSSPPKKSPLQIETPSPAVAPISIVVHTHPKSEEKENEMTGGSGNDRTTTPIFSSHIPPLNLKDDVESPTDIFKQFEDRLRAYSEMQREKIEKDRDTLEQLKEEIAFNEDKKLKLVSQVETLEKQIRAIRSMLM